MKKLQTFSKYTIWLSIFGIPLLWFLVIHMQIVGGTSLRSGLTEAYFHLSLLAVIFVMMIRPLADIFSTKKILKKLIILRKPLGIFSAMIIVTLMISAWIKNPDIMFFNYFSAGKWQWGYPIIARSSEITAVILLLTSNMWSMKKLKKNWKRIQKLSYVYFFSGAIIAARWEHATAIYTIMGIVVILWIWAEIIRRKKRA